MTIQRYGVALGSIFIEGHEMTVPDTVEQTDGAYVHHSDHAAELAAKDAEIERFRETIRQREQAELTALAELDEARAEIVAAVAREREECAKVAEQMPCKDPGSFGDGFSAACNEIECAIRSRPTPGAAKEV